MVRKQEATRYIIIYLCKSIQNVYKNKLIFFLNAAVLYRHLYGRLKDTAEIRVICWSFFFSFFFWNIFTLTGSRSSSQLQSPWRPIDCDNSGGPSSELGRPNPWMRTSLPADPTVICVLCFIITCPKEVMSHRRARTHTVNTHQ